MAIGTRMVDKFVQLYADNIAFMRKAEHSQKGGIAGLARGNIDKGQNHAVDDIVDRAIGPDTQHEAHRGILERDLPLQYAELAHHDPGVALQIGVIEQVHDAPPEKRTIWSRRSTTRCGGLYLSITRRAPLSIWSWAAELRPLAQHDINPQSRRSASRSG